MARHAEKLIGDGKYFEGLRWYDGRWYASDALNGIVFAVDENGQREDLAQFQALCSGLGRLPDKSLLVVSIQDKTLRKITPDGQTSVHADLSDVCEHWANDMFVDHLGRAWVGTIGFALHEGEMPKGAPLFRVDPDGSVTVAAEDLWCPNGIVVTPDGRTLIVAESFAGRLTAFTIDEQGNLSDRRVWAQFGTAPATAPVPEMLEGLEVCPDGLALDSQGYIWAADAANRRCIRVAPGGEIVDEVAHPQNTNLYSCALGGADGRTLLLAASEGIFEALAGLDGTAELLTAPVTVPA